MQNFILNNPWINTSSAVLMTLSSFFLGRDFEFLKDKHPHLFFILGEYVAPFSIWILALSFIVFLFVNYIEYKGKPVLKAIKEDLKNATEANEIISERIKDLFDGYLYNLSSKLGCEKSESYCERITIFLHDNNKNLFPFSRYSDNPNFRKIKRSIIPDNEGCVAKAWENGWHFDSQFPCSKENLKEYIDYSNAKYLIPKSICKQLSMSSRLYASLRIENNGHHVGVIVIESKNPTRFEENYLRIFLTDQSEFLYKTLQVLNNYIPRPSISNSRGL